MPKQKNTFLQFIAAVNNNTHYTPRPQNNSSIIGRIEDVLSMAPAHILQRFNKTTFDKEMKRPENKKNRENKITVSIFKAFLRFSEEEQMTIQKFLHCSCFDKIVKYMTPEQKVETCKHIEKYIETIQNSINATVKPRKRPQQKTKPTTKTQKTKQQTTLPTEEIPESTKEAPENTRNVQGLIQELKEYTVITNPTEDNTKIISATIKQLQQKTINFPSYDAENLFISTLYETLNIGKLDNIGVPATTTQTILRKKQDTKDTQAEQLKTTPAKKRKVAQIIKGIQATAKKIKEEKRRERGNEKKKRRRKKKIDNALKKQEEKPIVETKEEKEAREAAETKARYQIISLIHDTPHKKELKEQYIKDNPQIKKHELSPMLEAIHNYIYEESDTEQESEQSTVDQKKDKESINSQENTQNTAEQEKDKEDVNSQENTQNTTEQEKKQISALAIVHNTVPIGHKQFLELHTQANKLQICAQDTPAYIIRYLYRILHNNLSPALENLCGSASIHQFIELHLVHGKNPNKLSAFLQSIFDLDQKIRYTENTDNKKIYHPTPLETSSLSLIALYINHYSNAQKIKFLQESEISDPKTEEEAKKSITDVLDKIENETATVPFELMQQLLETKHCKKITNNKKNTIQDIFAYIKEAKSCEKIALYKALSIKYLVTQHEHNQPKKLYKYNEKFINNKENAWAIEETIQLLFANIIFLELLRSPKQKNESSKNTSKNANYYLNPHKILATQQIIKKIILSLMQASDISYINIIESFNLTLKQHAQLIEKFQSQKPLKQITKFIFQLTYGETTMPVIIKKYEPIIQQIAQAQKTYFTDNETTISTEQTANIETETITEKTKHSRAPINLQDTTTQIPSSKQEQPKAQQLIAITQKRKRSSKHLLDAEHKTPRKKQYENTSPQSPTTLITEITSVQQNKAEYSQRQ